MTENLSSRPRAPIDLDEFERQLRDMQSLQKHALSDPLAELARIVGHEDTSVMSQAQKKQVEPDLSLKDTDKEPAQQSQAASIFDELSNLRKQNMRGSADQGTFELEKHDDSYKLRMDDAHLHEQPFAGEPPEFLTGERADYFNEHDEPKPSRAGIKIFGAMVALGSLVAAGVWGFSEFNSGNLKIADTTPVIAAKTGPIKEKPLNPGGAEVPNLNADILQKNKDASKESPKLVPREEQPVDLSQAIKKDIRRVDLGQVSENGAVPVVLVPIPNAQTNGNLANGQVNVISPPVAAPPVIFQTQPKLPTIVNTMSSNLAPSNPALATSSSIVSAVPSVPVIAPPVLMPNVQPPEQSNAATGGPKKVKSVRITTGEPSVQSPVKTEQKPVQKTVAPKPAKTTPVPPPKVTPELALRSDTQDTTSDTPLAITPPAGVSKKGQKLAENTTPVAKAAKPVKASIEEPEASVESQTDPAPTRSAGAGKFSVQFGAPGSTAEAQNLISRLKSKYPSVMGSVEARVVKAQVNGRDVYRVRSGSISKDQANALCTDLKAAGGSCFISGG